MSRSLTLALAAAAVLAAPLSVSAQETAAAATKAATMSESDLNKRVCKGITPTGSRLKKGKVCKTQRQWLAEAAADRQNLDRMQKQPLKTPGD